MKLAIEIEQLRNELHRVIDGDRVLTQERIVEISQKLDKLIERYHQQTCRKEQFEKAQSDL